MEKKAALIILIIFIQMLSPLQVLADYTINDGRREPVPDTYVLSQVVNNPGNLGDESGYLKDPRDLFIDKDGYIYVADTGNSRIVKLSPDVKMMAVFKGPEKSSLKNPEGVFVDEDGDIYVADTGNLRILHMSRHGELVEEFVSPESDLLGEFFTFNPSKLCISPTGYIYVIKSQNILTLDAYNRFRGYLGQQEIGFSLRESLLRMFASEAQKRVLRKRLPPTFINMDMDDNGVIYTTSVDRRTGEIKKLNSVGKNIYRKYSVGKAFTALIDNIFYTSRDLENRAFVYGERRDDNNNAINPVFADIAVDTDGIVTVVEENTGKIYQYDQAGNLLTVFGGKGEKKGMFNLPTSLDIDSKGRILVLDRTQGNIQVFEPTRFIKLIHEAVSQYSKGNYDEAYSVWRQVLAIDENYQLGHLGLANVLYKKGEWKEAMEEYLLAEDRSGYSKAYAESRYEFFRQNFVLVIFTLVLSLILLIRLIILINRASQKALDEFTMNKIGRTGTDGIGIGTGLLIALGVLFRPLQTFEGIKNGRKRLNFVPGVLILAMALMVRFFYIFMAHYPLADVDIRGSNLILETVKILVPVFTWMIASFAITSILDGESKIGEIFLTSTYCMVPYIVFTSLMAVVSNILSRNEFGFYSFIINCTWIWVLLLFFLSIKVLNNYSIFRALTTYAVSCVTMLLIWLTTVFCYVVTRRIYQFVVEVMHEIHMIWF